MSISLNNFTCPHCLKANATLFDSAIFVRPIAIRCYSIVFTCKSCDKSLVLDLDHKVSATINGWLSNKVDTVISVEHVEQTTYVYNIAGQYIGRCSYYPQPQEPTIPEHLSDAVSKNMREAKELFLARYFNQSGMTSRRTMDLATKELLPEHTGMLNGRIKQLLDKKIITQQLFDWAEIVKLGGNSANHDCDDFSEHDAKYLLDFTEMFLMYAFTLPKMVEIKRGPAEEPEEESS